MLGRVTSHRPTYTVYIDRPAKVAELWPLIDDLTAEHGIVTSLIVPGYRERAGETVHGHLDFDTAVPAAWRAVEPDAPELPAGGEGSPWVDALLERVREFVREQGIAAPVVHVTLADGERFYLQAVEAGPGADMVTLHPYADRYDSAPPRAVIVPHRSIAKLELLVKPPRGTRSLVTLRRVR